MGKIIERIRALLSPLRHRPEASTNETLKPEVEKAADLRRIGTKLSEELKLMLQQAEWSRERFVIFKRVLNREMFVYIDDDEHELQTLVEVVIDTARRFNLPPLHLVVYPTEHEVRSIGRFGTSPEELARLVDRIHSYLWAYVYNIPDM